MEQGGVIFTPTLQDGSTKSGDEATAFVGDCLDRPRAQHESGWTVLREKAVATQQRVTGFVISWLMGSKRVMRDRKTEMSGNAATQLFCQGWKPNGRDYRLGSRQPVAPSGADSLLITVLQN